MKQSQVFEADDGSRFDSEEACLAYEACLANANIYKEWCKDKQLPLGLKSFATFTYMTSVGHHHENDIKIAVERIFPKDVVHQQLQVVSNQQAPQQEGGRRYTLVDHTEREREMKRKRESLYISTIANSPHDMGQGYISNSLDSAPLLNYSLKPVQYDPQAHMYDVESVRQQAAQLIEQNGGKAPELPQAKFGGTVMPMSGITDSNVSTLPRNFFDGI